MKSALAGLIRNLHTLIILIALVGWLSPSLDQLKAYCVFMVLVMGQWAVCDNRCVLTIWEDKLRGAPEGAGSESFIGKLLGRTIGWRPSERTVTIMSYGIGMLCLSLALLRISFVQQ